MGKSLEQRAKSAAYRHRSMSSQQGLTLIEVAVAISIMALIAVISYQALDVTANSREVIDKKVKEIERLDRVWMLIEGDVRNIVGAVKSTIGRGDPIPAISIDADETYWITLLRGGNANPLNLPRTELIRVGYRLEDDTLWRDSWIDASNPDTDLAKKQKLIEGVTEILVRVMPREGAKTVANGPWVDRWPQDSDATKFAVLPMALEITITFEGIGELKRLFALPKGEGLNVQPSIESGGTTEPSSEPSTSPSPAPTTTSNDSSDSKASIVWEGSYDNTIS